LVAAHFLPGRGSPPESENVARGKQIRIGALRIFGRTDGVPQDSFLLKAFGFGSFDESPIPRENMKGLTD
jgi:hypothetical protein